MDYLLEIKNICKCSVSVTINKHLDYYQTAKEAIDEDNEIVEDCDREIIDKMIELNTIVYVQAYVITPIGFIDVYHYDLTEALKIIYEILINKKY